MDEQVLAAKGIQRSQASTGLVEDYALRIGERATLIQQSGGRAYGLVMDVDKNVAAKLYLDESVADYVPEPVIVELLDGARVEATCYNLPVDKVRGTNTEYAQALLTVAARLGFPDDYLDEIRLAIS